MKSAGNQMEYLVNSRRLDAHGSLAQCKTAEIILDTDVQGRPDAFNPAELLLAALSACIIKGIERVTLILNFRFRSVALRVREIRQDAPPRLKAIEYEILIDSDEPDRRLELLHENVKKFGTVFNTLAPGTSLSGVLVRIGPSTPIERSPMG